MGNRELAQLKKSFLCKNCNKIRIVQLQACVPECDCSEELTFTSVFDFYANLYYHLDNVNYADYETICNEFNDEQIKDKVDNLLFRHLPEGELTAYPVNSSDYLQLVIKLFKQTVASCQTSNDILLVAVNWLFFLSNTMKELRKLQQHDSYFGRNLAPIPTIRGPLLYRVDSSIKAYLERFEAIVDPNYILLRKKVYFFLVREEYPYYNVTHKYISLSKRWADIDNYVGNLSFCFFSYNFSLLNDYVLSLKDSDDGNYIFSFTNIRSNKRSEYTKKFQTIITDKTEINFIMAPELSTPIDAQKEMIAVIKRQKRKQLIFAITGSFHVCEGDISSQPQNLERIYNYAQVVNHEGSTLYDLYKMNRFIIHKSDKNQAELPVFVEKSGTEQNAYDKRDIVLFDTLLGRIAFLICVDLINFSIDEILIDRQVDVVFVISMTPNPAGGKFIRKMQELSEGCGAVVFLCNNPGSAQVGGENLRGLAHFPLIKKVFKTHETARIYTLEEMLRGQTRADRGE